MTNTLQSWIKTAAVMTIALQFCDCETYQKIPLMPDGLNYNHYFNDDGSPGQDSVGVSWGLARHAPYAVNNLK